MARKIFSCCPALFFSLSYGLAAGPLPVLGQVIAQGVAMDGLTVPSGTTVLNQTVLETSANPAIVHLSSGQVVELHRNSSAYLERTEAGGVRIVVRAGTLSYAVAGGGLATALPEKAVVFSTGTLPTAASQEAGMQVILTEPAQEGRKTITVNDAMRLDPQRAILIRSRDGQTQAIHYVQAVQGQNVTLTAPLKHSFEANSTITQDPDVVTQAVAAGVALAGGLAGLSAGGVAVGGAAAAAAGASSAAAAAGIVSGAIAIASGTLATMAVTKAALFEDPPPPPVSP